MYECIEAHRDQFEVAMMCELLEVSNSAYYAWRSREPSDHELRDRELGALIREVFEEHQERYGAVRVWKELQARGVDVGRDRVARIMRETGLVARSRRTRKPRTTDSSHDYRIAPNLLERDFVTQGLDEVWLADITYLPTREGWLYLHAVLDLHSRRLIGWAIRDSLHRQGALDALSSALANREPAPGALHHSDRGVQYASDDYQAMLKAAGLTCSMSRKGDCWDNAPMESFFGRLKEELGVEVFETKAAARQAVFKYIEMYYNRVRRHSALGYISPEEFELENVA